MLKESEQSFPEINKAVSFYRPQKICEQLRSSKIIEYPNPHSVSKLVLKTALSGNARCTRGMENSISQ